MSEAAKSLGAAAPRAFKMPNDLYHSRPELSNSQNNILIDKSPAHFMEYKTNPPKQTEAMLTGMVVHTALLEPELFLDTHAAAPECDRRTKAGKDMYEEFSLLNAGKTIMKNDLYHMVFGMIGSVMAHPVAKQILTRNHNELSFFSKLRDVKVRCRPDILRGSNLIADLKTTEDASFHGFQRAVAKYHYARQAAFYADTVASVTGGKYESFVFIAVEKHAPYAVQVFALDEASMDKGREEYRRGLDLYHMCLSTNTWPAYSNEIMPLNLPSYAWGE